MPCGIGQRPQLVARRGRSGSAVRAGASRSSPTHSEPEPERESPRRAAGTQRAGRRGRSRASIRDDRARAFAADPDARRRAATMLDAPRPTARTGPCVRAGRGVDPVQPRLVAQLVTHDVAGGEHDAVRAVPDVVDRSYRDAGRRRRRSRRRGVVARRAPTTATAAAAATASAAASAATAARRRDRAAARGPPAVTAEPSRRARAPRRRPRPRSPRATARSGCGGAGVPRRPRRRAAEVARRRIAILGRLGHRAGDDARRARAGSPRRTATAPAAGPTAAPTASPRRPRARTGRGR